MKFVKNLNPRATANHKKFWRCITPKYKTTYNATFKSIFAHCKLSLKYYLWIIYESCALIPFRKIQCRFKVSHSILTQFFRF